MNFLVLCTLLLFAAPMQVVVEPERYVLPAMEADELFGLMKRQFCGFGTCAQACGPGYKSCGGEGSDWCYDPTDGQFCCGTGDSNVPTRISKLWRNQELIAILA
jgi:hypothetical protein